MTMQLEASELDTDKARVGPGELAGLTGPCLPSASPDSSRPRPEPRAVERKGRPSPGGLSSSPHLSGPVNAPSPALSVLELGRPGFWTTSVASLPLPTLSEQSPSCLHLGTPSTSFWAQVWSQDVRGGRHNLLWVLLAFSAADHSQGQTAWQGPGAAQLGLRERAHPLRGDALWNGPEARTRTRPSCPAVSSREKQLRLGLLHPLTCLCPTCFPPQHPQEGTTA